MMQKNKTSFVFIDVDGVLNNEIWYGTAECLAIDTETDFNKRHFDPRCVDLLNYLTNQTGAKLVVSSSWRNGRTIEELRELFKYVGITGEVFDKTPRLTFDKPYCKSVPRGCEIKAWLEANKSILGDKLSRCKYVILDDDTDMLYWQRNNYIQVDSYCGLTYNTIEKAIATLNVNVDLFL